jgi:hypothetical protein
MGSEWMLDVLTDLKSYAQKNGMAVLAEQLDDARLVAAAELATRSAARPSLTGRIDGAQVGAAHRAS